MPDAFAMMHKLLSRTRTQSAGSASSGASDAAERAVSPPRRRGNSILSFGRGRASATSATTAASGSTPPEESTSPEPGSAEADVRTPDQVRLIEQLVERTACDAGIASMALEASLWDLEAAAVLQSKLVEADAELEREQKELFRQEVELYVEKFNEAIEVQKKMQEMEQHLLAEDEELQRQHRMVEIDRREAELYPEEGNTKGEASMGDDLFTRNMKEHGLKHVRGDGSEANITADMLPPEFDLGNMSIPDCPVDDPTPPPPDQPTADSASAAAVADTDPQTKWSAEIDTPLPQLTRRRSSVCLSIDGFGPRAATSEPDLTQLVDLRDNRPADQTQTAKIDPFGGLKATKSMRDISFAF